MEKPFVFGVATSGDNFTDREKETQRLLLNFAHGVNTVLISPRRWGKTSLVKKVAQLSQDNKRKVVYIDIFSCRTENEFYRLFATSILKQTSSKWEEWIENTKQFLSHINPKISIGADPMNDFSISFEAMIGLLPLGISLRLKTGKRDFVIDQIEKGETDLAILASDYKNKSVHSKVIYTEKLIPVATPEWAARNLSKPYMPELLIGKPLIAYSENLPLIELYFKTLSNIDIQENAAVTVPDLRIVLQFVLRGAGYSILPDYICAEELQRGSLINLYDHKDNPLNKLYLVWPKLNLRDPRVVFVKDYLLTQFLQEN